MYRFVVCIDIEAEGLQEAYRKLLARMNANDWESTDEVYDPEGELIEEPILQEARLSVLSSK